jgi:hypothetical protein
MNAVLAAVLIVFPILLDLGFALLLAFALGLVVFLVVAILYNI